MAPQGLVSVPDSCRALLITVTYAAFALADLRSMHGVDA